MNEPDIEPAPPVGEIPGVIAFTGTWFDGKTAQAHRATVTVEDGRLSVRAEGIPPVPDATLDACRIAPPLGSIPRTIGLPGGGRIETEDFAAVEALERCAGKNRGMRRVHFLERSLRTVLLCGIVLVLLLRSLVVWGIPALANRVATSIPPETVEDISRNTMSVLERRFLQPSELPPERKAALDAVLERVSGNLSPSLPCRLEYRKSPAIGPNAFALPSGIILVTDELVGLLEDDDEAAGVFVHEITHVQRRHGLRSVFQNAGVFLVISAVVGDVTSIATAAGALPMVLARSGYSRQFEWEADEAVVRYFHDRGRSAAPYLGLIRRLSAARGEYPGQSYVSTHPATAERIEDLEAYERSLEGE